MSEGTVEALAFGGMIVAWNLQVESWECSKPLGHYYQAKQNKLSQQKDRYQG